MNPRNETERLLCLILLCINHSIQYQDYQICRQTTRRRLLNKSYFTSIIDWGIPCFWIKSSWLIMLRHSSWWYAKHWTTSLYECVALLLIIKGKKKIYLDNKRQERFSSFKLDRLRNYTKWYLNIIKARGAKFSYTNQKFWDKIVYEICFETIFDPWS